MFLALRPSEMLRGGGVVKGSLRNLQQCGMDGLERRGWEGLLFEPRYFEMLLQLSLGLSMLKIAVHGISVVSEREIQLQKQYVEMSHSYHRK